MQKYKRVYRHYEDLEEFHSGMWKIVRGEQRKSYMADAASLMKDYDRFKEAMRRAIVEWPISCEAAFTADGVNHLAWLGHAGCCIEAGSPEEATRAAWHTLSKTQQDKANEVAAIVLEEWQASYKGSTIDLFS